MTTAKQLNSALANGAKYVGDDEVYEFSDVLREESDLDLGPLGVLKWVDAFRDRDEPDVYVILWEHEDLLYAVYGNYDSWNGVDFYETKLHPVKQVTKTIVDYVKREEA